MSQYPAETIKGQQNVAPAGEFFHYVRTEKVYNITKRDLNERDHKADPCRSACDPGKETVKTSKENRRGSTVKILDGKGNVIATVIYQPDKPLSCGAKVWVETRAEVIIT